MDVTDIQLWYCTDLNTCKVIKYELETFNRVKKNTEVFDV